ncbi:MAG: hypothetical protein NTW06_00315 [Candidatus Falkowbacteria bacterium]|nr:hypothetical protein [Candidatus Falkowbacteria bacterium]
MATTTGPASRDSGLPYKNRNCLSGPVEHPPLADGSKLSPARRGKHRRFCKKEPVILMGADNISGSRNPNGNVPNVNWNDDKMNVNYYNPDNSNENLRARAEVSGQEAHLFGFFVCKELLPASRHFRDFLELALQIQIYFYCDYI